MRTTFLSRTDVLWWKMGFQFFNPRRRVTISQGHLPHWDQEEATYFITWRLADSIPKELWLRWRTERDWWLQAHGINPLQSDWRKELEELPEADRRDFHRLSRALEKESDGCHGACVLREPPLATVVGEALRFFDGARYRLGDFVIMPNHVHVIVGGLKRNTLLKQVKSWKKWSALKINERLGRSGRLWQDESFDHLIRSSEAFVKLRRYIAENPAKAGLGAGEYLLWQRPDEDV